LEKDTTLPMIYMPDLLKATVGLMEADNSLLKRRVYNLGAMSFTPECLSDSIKKGKSPFLHVTALFIRVPSLQQPPPSLLPEIPEFHMHYAPDFRQSIADTWPKKLDDSNATADWGWKPDYDVDAMTRDIVRYLREDAEKR